MGADPEGPLGLDPATLTGESRPVRAEDARSFNASGWYSTALPECGEGSVYWYSHSPRASQRGAAADPERAQAAAIARARTRLRRYAVANRLEVLWTLTYAPEALPDDLEGVWRDAEDFRRQVRKLVGQDVPLALVPERGGASDRLHLHFLAPRRALSVAQVEAAWRGRGWVSLRYRNGKRPGEGARARCRRVAAYLSAYLSPDQEGPGKRALRDRAFNGRRYSVTKGFQPVAVRMRARDVAEARAWLAERCGGVPEWRWSSDQDPEWPGSPVETYRFSDP